MGTGKLSDVARHVVLPAGIVSTGWPAVRQTCREIQISFDPWQDGAGRAILAKRSDGLYAADTVVISIPRQVGKTFLIGAIVFALCIINPGLTVIWTAHRFKTAKETFTSMRGMAGRAVMSAHVASIYGGAGNESILFRNGSRVVFGARERGGGRGFSGVDVLVLDEAQILTGNALDDLVPTTNAAPNPLILLTGTPPKPADPGEAFTELRREALDGHSDATLYIEFSADADADPDDQRQWAKANPSYPARTPARAIERMRRILSADSFLREGLGIWDGDQSLSVIDADSWQAIRDPASKPAGGARVAFGVAVRRDHRQATIGVAAERPDGLIHVGIAARAAGTLWVPEWAVERSKKWRPVGWALNPAAPAGTLAAPLFKEKIEPALISGREWAAACGALYTAVQERTIRHAGNAELAASVGGAGKRPLGDAWQWHPASADADITGIQAVSLALAALGHRKAKKPRSGRVVAA